MHSNDLKRKLCFTTLCWQLTHLLHFRLWMLWTWSPSTRTMATESLSCELNKSKQIDSKSTSEWGINCDTLPLIKSITSTCNLLSNYFLPESYPTASWQLPDSYPTAIQQLPNSYLTNSSTGTKQIRLCVLKNIRSTQDRVRSACFPVIFQD